MEIYNVKEKQEYIEEIARLSKLEWAEYNTEEELNKKIQQTIKKIKDNLDNPYYCKLILLDNDNLVGFISIYETDGDEYQELKEYIASKIRQNAPHNLYEREAALLYAEYHRREYGFRNVGDNTDNRPKALVFNSLGIHEV